jgi:hypothetical protein
MYQIHIVFFLCLFGCQEASLDRTNASYQEISGRDFGDGQRFPVYRARVPTNWQRIDPAKSESIVDTTKPVCTFVIKDNDVEEEARLSIHNFPIEEFAKSIPASAQVARWKGQFAVIDPISLHVTPCSHGGFAGLRFEATGIQKNKPTTILAWAMQLAPQHCNSLSNSIALISDANQTLRLRQMRADYTIKAVGDPQIISKHMEEIVDFADTFELIEEIPFCPY